MSYAIGHESVTDRLTDTTGQFEPRIVKVNLQSKALLAPLAKLASQVITDYLVVKFFRACNLSLNLVPKRKNIQGPV